MNSTRSPFLVFPVVGLCSGLFSGFSVVLQPLGIIAPGVLFGIAICHSVHTSIRNLSSGQQTKLIVATTCGYLTAVVCSLCSFRLPGFDNGLLDSSYAGAIGGGAGAFVVASAHSVIIPALSPSRLVFAVTLTGVLLGLVFMLAGVYISDHTAFGHPYDDIVTFPMWQMGVASVIPFCQRRYMSRQGDMSATPRSNKAR